MKKKILVFAMIVLVILLGYLRDYIFVSINSSIDSGADGGGNLSLLKWVLTFLFCVFYLFLTSAFLKVLFNEKKYFILPVLCYALLIGVSLLTAGIGYFFSSFEHVYPFIRMVMGVAQSPIILMVLIAGTFLKRLGSG
jgi:hypothetical protein